MPVEEPSTASTTDVEEMSSAVPLPRQGTRNTVSIFDKPVRPVLLRQKSEGYQIFLMLPYVLSNLALIVMSQRAAYPKALMVPYRKGER